jgi:hypothetical protein
MTGISVRTAVLRVSGQRRGTTALAAVGAAVVLVIAIFALKGQLPVQSLVHAFDRIPASFRHGLFELSGGHLVEDVAHHVAPR